MDSGSPRHAQCLYVAPAATAIPTSPRSRRRHSAIRVIAQRHGQIGNAVLHGDLEPPRRKGKMPSPGPSRPSGKSTIGGRSAVRCAFATCTRASLRDCLSWRETKTVPKRRAIQPINRRGSISAAPKKRLGPKKNKAGMSSADTWLGKIRPRCERSSSGEGLDTRMPNSGRMRRSTADTAHAAKGAVRGWDQPGDQDRRCGDEDKADCQSQPYCAV